MSDALKWSLLAYYPAEDCLVMIKKTVVFFCQWLCTVDCMCYSMLLWRPGGELKPGEDQVEGLKRLLTEVCIVLYPYIYIALRAVNTDQKYLISAFFLAALIAPG